MKKYTMLNREKLLSSKEYWITKIQIELFNHINDYLKNNDLTRTDFAKQLGVNKSYVSQILNGDFNFSLSKLVELSLAVGLVPRLEFQNLEEVVELDRAEMENKKQIKPLKKRARSVN